MRRRICCYLIPLVYLLWIPGDLLLLALLLIGKERASRGHRLEVLSATEGTES